MGKNQNTFEKRRREVEKKQRAEEKRKRRQSKKSADTVDLPESDSKFQDTADPRTVDDQL
jgi:hypothetical protein